MKVVEPFTQELAKLLRRMCYHGEDLEVENVREGNFVDIYVTPNNEDRGLLIGSNERVLNAIKQVAILASRNFGIVAAVHIHEGKVGSRRSAPHVFEHNAGATDSEYVSVAENWLRFMFGREVAITRKWDGEQLTLRAAVNGKDDGKEITALTALGALGDIMYAIGQREGVVVKLKPLRERAHA